MDIHDFHSMLFPIYGTRKASYERNNSGNKYGHREMQDTIFTDTHFGTLYDGNHDYGGGAVRIYEQFMNNCGFYVLDNETVFLEKFNIEVIGFDDYLLGQTEVDFYHIQSDNFHLIAMHEPVISKWIEGSGENLILSEKNKELPSLYS